ncbi:MAG: exodeoxyribonuclease III [Alphaproteobacteria bacterium]|nr:exodeoxyribonuclease III [Alphaproteobacteria bacterium]MBU1527178.1 exodeoxyribonuclease III [Alphaproteobacteria bacterium]MBU2116585.1 exodeoxyribonuclease III [Alphaproteobacteria bacterium]MBU2352699.1 exodeoxyribonuclease III [Alphaproteobacteria bacterium]MBU2382066.1 exodeoxyribonuclease III [Alphaproteobacteria bacterium]
MLRVVTWNINSVRLRIDQVARFVAEARPDVLMLQEIKCTEDQFPRAAFEAMGLPHLRLAGQKGWHGVAIASRLPITDAARIEACREGHGRCVAGTIAGIEFQNFYIPAGGDVADRALNPKFDHKLDFYARLTADVARRDRQAPLVMAGDFNIAPGENDVWNHKYMSKIVSHTPVEVETLRRLQDAGGFADVVRDQTPEPVKLASWWSYRAVDFRKSARGLRLDHVWTSPGLTPAVVPGSAVIHEPVRAWDRPSDHAPVAVDLDV